MNVANVMALIDRASEPKRMTKQQALAFLEQVESEIRSRKKSLLANIVPIQPE